MRQASFISSTKDALINQKKGLHQKKVVFYPDMAQVAENDKLLYQFLQKDYGDPFEGKAIDPDVIDYQCPDFGFDNDLIFEEKDPSSQFSSNWRYFMDYSSPFPRFERLKNYI